ncbi:hypothetical protein [Pararhodobacter oceanensis]|uniref:DUF7946 domain-containing protein n=1 Tax=Pararhodobacter oceanensis TaxID=2172121 RepID=UPI003A913515
MADVKIPYKVIFTGLDADENQLEAYAASKSLEGLTWALSTTINFSVTGKYKSRGDMSKSARIFMSPARQGSFIVAMNAWVVANPFLATITLGGAVSFVAPYVNKTIEYAFGKALGSISDIPDGFKKYYNRLSKDERNQLDTLIQRIEPPLSRAHMVIGQTAAEVAFKSRRTELFKMDEATKEYIEAKPLDAPEMMVTNITAYNVVSRNGRMYDPVNRSTAAFTLIKSPLKGTANTITTSLDQYQAGRKGLVKVTADRVQTESGRLKKFLVSAAEEIAVQDWENGQDPLRSVRN